MNRFQQRRVGRTDLQVSVLGLGGAPLGDLYERIPRERAPSTTSILEVLPQSMV